MYKYLFCLPLIGCACANNINKDAEIRNFQNEASDAEGNYQFAYETSNGSESGNGRG